jgi:hypothetical protein
VAILNGCPLKAIVCIAAADYRLDNFSAGAQGAPETGLYAWL